MLRVCVHPRPSWGFVCSDDPTAALAAKKLEAEVAAIKAETELRRAEAAKLDAEVAALDSEAALRTPRCHEL